MIATYSDVTMSGVGHTNAMKNYLMQNIVTPLVIRSFAYLFRSTIQLVIQFWFNDDRFLYPRQNYNH